MLGRQSSWPQGMYSCLSGFVDVGESAEEAVNREVWNIISHLIPPLFPWSPFISLYSTMFFLSYFSFSSFGGSYNANKLGLCIPFVIWGDDHFLSRRT